MPQLKNKSVLVFGEDTRSFLSVIRSLGKAGMQVDVVCFSNNSPALYSKYINQCFLLNHRSLAMDEWLAEVESILIQQQYDLVIPCDERALFPLIDIKEKLSLSTIFAVPDRAILAPLFDKTATRTTAELCNVPVANGEKLELNDISFSELTARFGLPLVLKPTQSYTEEQLSKRQSVEIAHDEDAYNDFKLHNTNQQTLVESYFSGYGIGVSVLANNGHVKAAFAHARVAEPESGGGSSYRKAIKINPDMLFACQKFCLQLHYTGVAMFEFKFNPDTRDWILIEINARFWGSLPLAVFSGVDFPALYAAILLGVKITDKLAYNQQAYARSFTADLYDMKAEFDRNSIKHGKSKALLQLTKRVTAFARLATGNDSIDSFQWQDPAPFKNELLDLFKDKLTGLPLIRKRQQISRITQFKQTLKDKATSSNPINEVLFICYGNIMRSPFAEKLFVNKVKNTSLATLKIDSFGFHQVEHRHAKTNCIDMATHWQVDLSQHKSKWIRQQRLTTNNPIVIIFDQNNEHILQSYYPDVSYISLADLIPAKYGFYKEIEDPYGKSPDYLKKCYQLIDVSLEQLITIMDDTLFGKDT